MLEQDKGWISVEDIAKELGLHRDTVRGWIREGKLPAFKFGHVFRVKRTDYEAFVRSSFYQGSKQDEAES